MTLEIRNLTKRLGNHLAVDDVSFTIEEGEFFVLLGTSGSGKSTILRLIAGLDKPDAGQILSNDVDLVPLPSRSRNLAMVFQDYGLYPNMNVYQNIAYGLEAAGMKRQEIDQRISDAAQRLQIEGMLKRNITELSGGEQQRVALARALAKDAAMYLYDEPLSNLDPKLRYSARQDIQTVHRLKRKPSLYVTHDQTEAFALADRIGVLSHGKMQQIGTPEELLDAPVNTFVASFLSSPPINLITGEIARQRDHLLFCSDTITLRLPERWNHALGSYGKPRVVAGIRANMFSVANGHTPDVLVRGEIEFLEDLLGETIVSLKTGQQTQLTAALTEPEVTEWEQGQSVALAVDTENLLLFDIDTERSLAVS
jgi:multiple sugar transport system ATP-binding protein